MDWIGSVLSLHDPRTESAQKLLLRLPAPGSLTWTRGCAGTASTLLMVSTLLGLSSSVRAIGRGLVAGNAATQRSSATAPSAACFPQRPGKDRTRDEQDPA